MWRSIHYGLGFGSYLLKVFAFSKQDDIDTVNPDRLNALTLNVRTVLWQSKYRICPIKRTLRGGNDRVRVYLLTTKNTYFTQACQLQQG